ncbi:MAG TPA: peroxidase family protein, partial [Chloroflexota bacterium]|nr:peroxidase family protein [Chloroflexota bacterium]
MDEREDVWRSGRNGSSTVNNVLRLAAVWALRRLGLQVGRSGHLPGGSAGRGPLLGRLVTAIDHRYGWHRLPWPAAILMLDVMRTTLRRENLHDCETEEPAPPPVEGTRHLTARTPDGSYNDLAHPCMGMAGARFGRNIPLDRTIPEREPSILEPNPRIISRELMTRDRFRPASTLNLLAAAWLQFMIHGWFSHGQNVKESPWQVECEPDDPWPEHPMTILRTRPDSMVTARDDSRAPTFRNVSSHWWDGSQIYGSDAETLANLRSGERGKLRMDETGLLPIDPVTGLDDEYSPSATGVYGNWWLGLSLFHTLFTREHNAICDRLAAEYPSWSDDDLFDHARLINAALMAKIHTVEWTPAILAHPALKIGMRANWWGLASERVNRLVGRISPSEMISGIPGSSVNHHAAPYAITEEFVAVYRMHPLLPDEICFRSARNHAVLQERTFMEIAFTNARRREEEMSMVDLLYSFGVANPGAITLHNYPRFLQRLDEPDGTIVDLAATDILRNRERGVPRYNDFRRLLHMRPVRSFEELTDNRQWAEEIRRVYDGDLERVDLMVGLYAETPPAGFGFSDTAFRIFLLMASRRLKSDRFFTTDFNARVYTQTGLDWIADNDVGTVLLRHHPQLGGALRGIANCFAPW